jgi:hypothetical protein
MKLKKLATALAYGALLQSTVAFAATETVGTSFGFNFSGPFALPAFDPALGTLTGVELEVDSSNIVQIDVFDDLQDEPQAFTATANSYVDFIGPDGANAEGTGFAEFDGTSAGFGGMEGPIEVDHVSGTASALDINAYEGASPLEISYSWSGGTSYSITPYDLNVGGYTQGSANFSVVYTYTPTAPVPEPSTWAMMLVGFAGLGLLGWRGLAEAWRARRRIRHRRAL